jgi:hypothetical protein
MGATGGCQYTNQPRQGNRNSKCPLGYNNEAAPDAGPLFFLCISCGRRTQPNPARVLCYFFFDLAFFFMTLFPCGWPFTR